MVELSTDGARVFVLFLDITIKCWYVGFVYTKNDNYLIIPVIRTIKLSQNKSTCRNSTCLFWLLLIEDKNKHQMKVICGAAVYILQMY